MQRTAHIMTVCKDDCGYITQLKEQKGGIIYQLID